MVASKGYQFGFGPGRLTGDGGGRVGCWLGVDGGFAGSKLQVRLTHLSQGEGVVERCDGDVAAVEDGERGGVWIERGAVVEAAEGGLAGGGSTDSSRAESRSCRRTQLSEYHPRMERCRIRGKQRDFP